MKAKKFDQQFDDGVDLTASLNLSKAKRALQEQKRVNRRDLAAGRQRASGGLLRAYPTKAFRRSQVRSDRRNAPDDLVNRPRDKVGIAAHPRRRRAAPAEP